jgi:hypothetical protein
MTLQEQFNAIKNGKGNKVQFLKQARSLFPQYLNQYSDYNTSVNVLKSKQIINEAVGGVVTKGFNITNWKQIFEAEVKAEEKTTSKEAADANKNAYQPSNVKNADNINFNEILKGYLAELGDVKNAGKTGDELKEIAVKNLAKDPLFYTKSGNFGIKGVGYTTEAPGLGEPKEAKGKHKSSGYGDIDKEIKVKANVKNSLGDQEAKDSMPKKVKEMPTTPQSSAGVKKMKMPGAEKKMKLQEIVTGENPYFDTDPSDGDADEDKNMAYGAENYHDKGKKAFDEGNLEKAQEYYEQALKFGSYIGWTERELPPYTKESLGESKLRSVIAKLIKEELKENLDAKYSPDETYKYAVECKYIIGFKEHDDIKYFKTEEEAKDYADEKPSQRTYVGAKEDLMYQDTDSNLNEPIEEQKLRSVIAKLIKEELKLAEDEADDLQAIVDAPYEDFVAKLGSNISDPKIQAILMKGKEDGQPTDEVINLSDIDIPVQKLQPTQNEIALDKSLIYPLTDVKSAEVCLKGGVVAIAGKRIITADGIYIVDGHHRWSQLYAMNKDASIAATNMTSAVIKQPLDFLKVTQAAIAADLKKVPTASAKGSINLITISKDQLKAFVKKTITKDVMKVFVKYGKVKVNSNKDADNLSNSNLEQAANYIWSNVQSMQSTSKPVSGAPKRDSMPQTDDATKWQDIASSGDLNFTPPFKSKTTAPVAESAHNTINSNLNESKLRSVIAKLIKEELKRSNISGSEYIEINGKVVRTYVQNGDKSYSVEYDDGTKDIIAVSNDAWSEINDLHMNATNLNEPIEEKSMDLRSDEEKKLSKLFDKKPEDLKKKYQDQQKNPNSSIFPKKESINSNLNELKLRSVIAKLIKEELNEDESDLDARLKKYVENEVPTGDWESIKNYYEEMTQDKPDPKRRYFELVDGILKKHGY